MQTKMTCSERFHKTQTTIEGGTFRRVPQNYNTDHLFCQPYGNFKQRMKHIRADKQSDALFMTPLQTTFIRCS